MGIRFPIWFGRVLLVRAFIKPVAVAALGRRFSRTFWQWNLLGLSICVCVLVRTAGNAEEVVMELKPHWEYVSDRVMGGVSNGKIETVSVDGRTGTRLTGLVSLENNGGFVQMAFNLPSLAKDASVWTGVQLEVYGNGEAYDLRLRTTALTRPWQSFRATFVAETNWQTVKIPFTDFVAHRTDATFDATELRRIGILAIGRVFEADVVVSRIGFYRE